MNCLEVRDRLQTLLDEGLPLVLEAAARAHLKECTACRELWGAADRLLLDLRREPIPEVPRDFSGRVVAGVIRQRRRSRLIRWWSGAAAAVLIGSLALWGGQAWLAPKARETGPVAKSKLPVPVPEPEAVAAVPVPSFPRQVKEAGQATLDLTRQLAQDTAEQASVLMPPATGIPSGFPILDLEAPDLPVREVGRSVSDGLAPVTTSARRAVDLWLHMLPPSVDDRPGS